MNGKDINIQSCLDNNNVIQQKTIKFTLYNIPKAISYTFTMFLLKKIHKLAFWIIEIE